MKKESSPEGEGKLGVFLGYIKSKRFRYYASAIILRLFFAFFFIDQDDGPVFFDTVYDIVIRHKGPYYEGSNQILFNYLPLAYFAILPGLAIYYLLGLDNPLLKVFFLKIPFIIGDIYLVKLISRPLVSEKTKENVTIPNDKKSEEVVSVGSSIKINLDLSRTEIFLLFNPFIIFTSSIKGQFDIIPVVFLIIGWRQFLEGKYWKSGMSIATGILMKQYGIILSVFIGLHLLKTKTREFPKFFFGHLLIAIPVLVIVSYFNFDGLVYHAILYHLGRGPSGYSFTSIFYFPITVFLRINYSSTYSVLIGNLIVEVFQATLIFSLVYLGYDMWRSENQISDVLEYMLFAFLCFFLMNNVLWIQYFIIFLVLWTEFKRITGQEIKMISIYWNYSCIPMGVIIRANLFTLNQVREFLGSYWFTLLWIVCISLHLGLIFYFHRFRTNMFQYWYIKLLFSLEVMLLPLHYFIMSDFGPVVDNLFP